MSKNKLFFLCNYGEIIMMIKNGTPLNVQLEVLQSKCDFKLSDWTFRQFIRLVLHEEYLKMNINKSLTRYESYISGTFKLGDDFHELYSRCKQGRLLGLKGYKRHITKTEFFDFCLKKGLVCEKDRPDDD
jgi:hypothetical protein